jgi:hypothetical protein
VLLRCFIDLFLQAVVDIVCCWAGASSGYQTTAAKINRYIMLALRCCFSFLQAVVGGGLLLGWGGVTGCSRRDQLVSLVTIFHSASYFASFAQAVVGGGLLLGWGGVNWMLSQQSSGATSDICHSPYYFL